MTELIQISSNSIYRSGKVDGVVVSLVFAFCTKYVQTNQSCARHWAGEFVFVVGQTNHQVLRYWLRSLMALFISFGKSLFCCLTFETLAPHSDVA